MQKVRNSSETAYIAISRKKRETRESHDFYPQGKAVRELKERGGGGKREVKG